MKKIKSFLSLTLLCIMVFCCFLFSGCSSSDVYKFSSLKYSDGNNSVTYKVGDTFEGMELKEDSYILILKENNTFILRVHTTETYLGEVYEETAAIMGSWTDGYKKELYLNVEDDDVVIGKKDGNKIIFDFDEIEVTLKK